MLENKKVSIVVPLYNVEKYIHRCIESILQQSYPNLEIILVNDGSPDNCGKIADDYGTRDTRIKVVHKENGGLSDARNSGMNEVTGEFTMFVDSDDWIEETMVETLLTHSLKYGADVVQSSFYYAYEDKLLIDKKYQKKVETLTLLNNKELMYELVTNKFVKNFAWGKLYKTELIRNIPFIKGVLFEDVFWAHQVMYKVDTYIALKQPMYYYYQRDDSIVATYSTKNLDILKGLKERHRFIECHYNELITESYKLILETSLVHYYLLQLNREKDKNQLHRKEIQNYIQTNYVNLKNAVKEDKSLRKQLYLFLIHPYVNMAYLGLQKILRKVKILPQAPGLERVDV